MIGRDGPWLEHMGLDVSRIKGPLVTIRVTALEPSP